MSDIVQYEISDRRLTGKISVLLELECLLDTANIAEVVANQLSEEEKYTLTESLKTR
ncbi:MAG: hypothetical protein H0V39_04610 [Nitrosomonas sp.]|nr:hypothetical protein [Nitrosomonas sp.]